MKSKTSDPIPLTSLAVLALVFFASIGNTSFLSGAEATGSAAPAPKLAQAIIGTWEETPADGTSDPSLLMLKFITGNHWCITHSDRKTGKVLFHHGGTYTLKGDEYVETVTYATEGTATLIGKTFKFKLKIEGDTCTQTGIENPYSSVLKRLN